MLLQKIKNYSFMSNMIILLLNSVAMTKHFLISLSVLISCSGNAQNVMSIGIFTGLSMPFTFDQGINSDPRYTARNDVKLCPIGINYGMDFDGYGFNFSPGIVTTGQNFNVVNTFGGKEGIRKIKMTYLNVPIGLKLHLIDLRLVRISFIASTGVSLLLDADEKISHNESKLRFPSQAIPNLPANYTVDNDAVLVPNITNYTMLNKSDFNKYQVNIAVGFRSDWNVSDSWRLSLDLRLNYGILESRNDAYLAKLDSHTTLYDIPGKRRDIFGNLNFGLSRYMYMSKTKTTKKKKGKKYY
jgi:hypothetical protein